jgi:hypothetical protein
VKHIPNDWSKKQNSLKILLSKEQTFNDGIELLLKMHGLLHDKKIYNLESFKKYTYKWPKRISGPVFMGRQS